MCATSISLKTLNTSCCEMHVRHRYQLQQLFRTPNLLHQHEHSKSFNVLHVTHFVSKDVGDFSI